jgi:uncharacterized membrane protein YfhO
MPLHQIEAALTDPQVNLLEEGLVEGGAPAVDPTPDPSRETVIVKSYEPNRLEFRVHALSRGLLVLSEIYDSGWRAQVDGHDQKILRVDGALRGLAVGPGESTVVLVYRPPQIVAGGILTVFTFLGGLAIYFLARREPMDSAPLAG